jgi:hypothetical protein
MGARKVVGNKAWQSLWGRCGEVGEVLTEAEVRGLMCICALGTVMVGRPAIYLGSEQSSALFGTGLARF